MLCIFPLVEGSPCSAAVGVLPFTGALDFMFLDSEKVVIYKILL